MKDFLGKEIEVGNKVVVTVPHYRSLVKAKVIALTNKKVRVQYNHFSYGQTTYLADPGFLVVIE